ncbi:toll/interleukin-1 receptor domain-containing protein [Acidicapsa dinghuensis]|uniref:Toll/interleukin-1 receptor domain-containing protein n=1 Tax=Acidicapsa dinghuensis TaxID=2218256 RepID=A0ABW1EAA2_9BACT|nr:toll/interleukin-1 receptor domain-containing protein [Acidicapsa dinghuensis]
MTAESGTATGTGRAIFISYRRDDTEGEAGRLFDDLVRAYGDTNVFMDVSGIEPGVDFRQAIDKNVSGCGVLLAVIGPTWATITGHDGTRRLDNPEDYVRLEISTALKRGIPVIPVLVHDAKMPALEQLPEDLRDLRYRNSVELTHTRWNSDVTLLIDALKSYVHVDLAAQTEPVHATVPVQLPAPQSENAQPARGSKLPLMLGLGGISVVLVVLLALLWTRSRQPSPGLQGEPTATQPQQKTPPDTAGGNSQDGGTVAPPGIPAVAESMLGKWQNSKNPAGGDDIAQITVANFGGRILVEVWGQCAGHLCAWGSRQGTVQGAAVVTGSWQLRNTEAEQRNQRSVALSLLTEGNSLQVTIKNHYQMQNGQTREIYNQFEFTKVQ